MIVTYIGQEYKNGGRTAMVKRSYYLAGLMKEERQYLHATMSVEHIQNRANVHERYRPENVE